jgi:hypothetical protein
MICTVKKQEQAQEPVKDALLSDVYKNTEQPSAHCENSHNSDSIMGGLFSILNPEPENHPKDDMPLPRRKKKKKRRYGR